MLDEKTIRSLAARIEQARKTHELMRPVTAQFPEATIEDAYAIQRAWVALRLAEGHRVLGHKIGLTSKAMQSQSSVKEPDYGCLLDDTMFATVPRSQRGTFTAPRVEVELAFILSKRLRGPGCTLFDVLNATDFLIPSMEILDSRLHRTDPETGKTRTIVDSIADNAGNAGLVTGGRPFKPHEADLDGSQHCVSGTARSRNRAWRRPSSATRPTASPGSPTSSPSTMSPSSRARSC